MLEPTSGYAEFLTDSYLKFEEKHYCLGWMCSLLSHTHCRKISEKLEVNFNSNLLTSLFSETQKVMIVSQTIHPRQIRL